MILESWMDFRKPEYRRTVFLRFYEFHLKYRAHAGCVYQFIPFLREYYKWEIEESLWFASINAFTQHPMTSLAIFQKIPPPPFEEKILGGFTKWFNESWAILPFDSDRKYQKKDVPKALGVLSELVKQRGSLKEFYTGDFEQLWRLARKDMFSLGRLGAWSGLEFIKIAGDLDFEFNTLFLHDIDGSRSHRNGLCVLLGRDDLDYHSKLNPAFDGKYTNEQLGWLEEEGEKLLMESKERFKGRDFFGDVGYQTLETTLCCYKSWHRKNRRYPSVYNDMAYSRLLDTQEKNPNLDLTPFWAARRKYLPKALRIEDNTSHPQYNNKSLSHELQNMYITTGKIPNLEIEWDCFNIK